MDALERWFGAVPDFHDAELVDLDLRREPVPSRLRVHAWRRTPDLDASGRFRTDRHTLVTFTIHGILELRLEDWNHRNMPEHLQLTPIEGGREIAMHGYHGLDGRLVARTVVVAVEPWRGDQTTSRMAPPLIQAPSRADRAKKTGMPTSASRLLPSSADC